MSEKTTIEALVSDTLDRLGVPEPPTPGLPAVAQLCWRLGFLERGLVQFYGQQEPLDEAPAGITTPEDGDWITVTLSGEEYTGVVSVFDDGQLLLKTDDGALPLGTLDALELREWRFAEPATKSAAK